MKPVTVSIVSHGHGALLPGLLSDLATCPEIERVIITRNIPGREVAGVTPGRVLVIDNPRPKGFGANHNAAFRNSSTPYFAVINPDIRFGQNPFPALLNSMKNENVALCAPCVVNPEGELEDSARQFPTVLGLAKKILGGHDGRLQFTLGETPRSVPWIAGMFMLFRSADYAAVSGFDEGYFLYYEDVDLCARLRKSGRDLMLCPEVWVEHDARRASHSNLRHLGWHLASVVRYVLKYRAYRKIPGVYNAN